jgi:hypothetical protein
VTSLRIEGTERSGCRIDPNRASSTIAALISAAGGVSDQGLIVLTGIDA